MKLLYMGTPESSANCLRRLAREAWPIVGVVTQPDRPKGRSRTLTPPPVKEAAVELGLPVYQPEKASAPEFIDVVRALAPDLTVIFAYGEIVTQAFLDVAAVSTVNLHLSLLPKYRGTAPVQWAILNGETTTGVTIIHLVRKMDAGDIILQRAEPIRPDDTGESLERRLAQIGAELLVDAIRALEAGTAPRIPQDHDEATVIRMLTKEDGLIDWTQPADAIERRVRAFTPWPGTYAFLPIGSGQTRLRILQARVAEGSAPPGELVVSRKCLCIGTGAGLLELVRVQVEGKRAMTAAEFLAGHRLDEGTRLTAQPEDET